MPKREEYAEIEVRGERFRDWTAVEVTREWGGEFAAQFTFQAVENSYKPGQAIKLKPGDPCIVRLAGWQVVNGYINVRQGAYDANQRGLSLRGMSRTQDIVRSSVEIERSQFRQGYSLEAIAKALCQPHGIDVRLLSSLEGSARAFRSARPQFGETKFAALERLCRLRGVFPVDTPEGNIALRRATGQEPVVAELEEGRNIKAAQCVINDEQVASETVAVGQQPGSDQVGGDAARDVSGAAKGPSGTRHLPIQLLAESPGDREDMKQRAQRENDERIGTQVQCQVVLAGWLRPDDKLWEIGDVVRVYSPMLFPNNTGAMKLGIKTTTFRQSSQGGTETELLLVLPEHLGAKGTPQASGSASNPFSV